MQHLLEWLIPAAQAHEKWFVPLSENALVPPQFVPGHPHFTVALIVIAVACAIGYWVDGIVEKSRLYARTEMAVRRFRDIAPGVLAVSTALLLIWSAAHGVLLADNFPLPDTALGTALRWAQYAVGAMLFVGINTVTAALGLGALWLAMAWIGGPVEALDYLYFAGIAVFLYYFARGRYSLDWFYGKPVLSTPEQRKHAYLAMRILTGLGFLALALVKWLHPDLHLALLDRYPDWNPYVILGWFGFDITRETYVLLTAAVETAVGVFVLGGFLTRFAAVALVPVFLGSILFLGPGELAGHLPILGILAVLFVYGDTYHKKAASAA